jgi:hypothetical protein
MKHEVGCVYADSMGSHYVYLGNDIVLRHQKKEDYFSKISMTFFGIVSLGHKTHFYELVKNGWVDKKMMHILMETLFRITV